MADDLIKRLTEATEEDCADPGLNARVIAAGRGARFESYGLGTGDSGEKELWIRWAGGKVGYYSRFDWPLLSLNTALTTVPEGYMVDQIGEWEALPLRAKGPWYAIVRLRAPTTEFSNARADHCPTPALALCIAALKAKEQQS